MIRDDDGISKCCLGVCFLTFLLFIVAPHSVSRYYFWWASLLGFGDVHAQQRKNISTLGAGLRYLASDLYCEKESANSVPLGMVYDARCASCPWAMGSISLHDLVRQNMFVRYTPTTSSFPSFAGSGRLPAVRHVYGTRRQRRQPKMPHSFFDTVRPPLLPASPAMHPPVTH